MQQERSNIMKNLKSKKPIQNIGCLHIFIWIVVCVIIALLIPDAAASIGQIMMIGIMVYATVMFIIFLSKGGYKKDVIAYMDKDAEKKYLEHKYLGYDIRIMRTDASNGLIYSIYNLHGYVANSTKVYLNALDALDAAKDYIHKKEGLRNI